MYNRLHGLNTYDLKGLVLFEHWAFSDCKLYKRMCMK